MMNSDRELDDGFMRYRDACPDREGSADFMPRLWERSDGRRSFGFVFGRIARVLAATSAAACLLLAGLGSFSQGSEATSAASYADALAADHSVERTYYTEAIQEQTQPLVPATYRH